MKKQINFVVKIFTTLSLFLFPFVSLATDAAYKGLGDKTGTTGALGSLTKAEQGGAATNTNSLPTIIGGLIGQLLGILGVILVVYVIQAGIMYMTAAGDATKVEKAKKMMTQAIIGIIIIVMAWAISKFVIDMIIAST